MSSTIQQIEVKIFSVPLSTRISKTIYLFCSDALEVLGALISDHKAARNPDVLIVKAETMYHMGSFEHALLNYHRAFKLVSNKVRTVDPLNKPAG